MSAKYASARLNRGSLLGFCAAGFLILATPAIACDLAVEAPEAVRIDYNPFAIGASSGPLNILFDNRAETACELRLVLIDDVGNPLPALVVGGVVMEVRPRGSSGLFRRDVEPGAFVLSMAEKGVVRAEMDVAVMDNAVIEAGEHHADFRLAIQAIGGEPLRAPLPIRVILKSAPRAQVNIAGAAGAFGSGSSVEVVDFGTAAAGVTRRVFVQVRANTASTLTVRSQHHGLLQHLEMAGKGAVIAYAVELDGLSVDLADAWTHRVDPPRTLAGVSLPMDLTLGAITGQMSGRYEDLLTIDITPN